MTVSADGVDVAYTEGGGRTELRPNSIICSNSGGEMTTFNAEGINFGQTQSIITGISDSKGTSSRIAVSQKCLADNYLPLSGGTLTGALKATKFTGDGSGLTNIPAEQLTGTIAEARLPDLSGKYLPISGGTITGDTTIMGTNGQYGLKIVNGDIYFLTDGGSTILNIIGGITSEKGISAYHAMSQKGVADNYVAKTDISDAKGTDTTKVPSLKCLNDNYLPLSGGTINGDLQISGTTKIDEFKIYKDNLYNICLDGTEVYSDVIVKLHEPTVGPEKNFGFAINDGNTHYGEPLNLFSVSRENCTINSEGISINASNASSGVNFGCGSNGYFYMNENKIGWDGANDAWSISGIQFSTEDLVAGTSPLTTDRIYIVYE